MPDVHQYSADEKSWSLIFTLYLLTSEQDYSESTNENGESNNGPVKSSQQAFECVLDHLFRKHPQTGVSTVI